MIWRRRRPGLACSELHGDHGVELRLGIGVAAIEGIARVEQVRLTDGSVVPADVVVVGIGVAPATGWLEGSGLELRDGVVCDATLAAAGYNFRRLLAWLAFVLRRFLQTFMRELVLLKA